MLTESCRTVSTQARTLRLSLTSVRAKPLGMNKEHFPSPVRCRPIGGRGMHGSDPAFVACRPPKGFNLAPGVVCGWVAPVHFTLPFLPSSDGTPKTQPRLLNGAGISKTVKES